MQRPGLEEQQARKVADEFQEQKRGGLGGSALALWGTGLGAQAGEAGVADTMQEIFKEPDPHFPAAGCPPRP